MITKYIGEYLFGLFIATCKTEGCENHAIPIELWIDLDGGLAICGPCGTQFIPENVVEKAE